MMTAENLVNENFLTSVDVDPDGDVYSEDDFDGTVANCLLSVL